MTNDQIRRFTTADNSDDLKAILRQLNTVQIRFCVARVECRSDKEAAEMIGVSTGTVKSWNDDGDKLLVDEAVRLMAYDGVITAMEIRRRNLAKAMAIKAAGLDVGDERLRQSVATEIIEWELGKATQRSEVDANIDSTIRVTLTGQDDNS